MDMMTNLWEQVETFISFEITWIKLAHSETILCVVYLGAKYSK